MNKFANLQIKRRCKFNAFSMEMRYNEDKRQKDTFLRIIFRDGHLIRFY